MVSNQIVVSCVCFPCKVAAAGGTCLRNSLSLQSNIVTVSINLTKNVSIDRNRFVCAGNNGSTVCMTCFVWPDERTEWIALSSGYQEHHPMPPVWRACQNEEDQP